MKKKKNLFQAVAIGLFVVAMLLNVSLTVDSGNGRNADMSLGNLEVSLFQKAYAYEIIIPGYCVHWCDDVCPYDLPPGEWIANG